MQKPLYRLVILLSVILVAGCQYVQFPGVYKINIQQGNIINQEMVDQLKPGMTKRQVRFVMGNPLVEDTFTPDRWDYYYSMVTAGGKETKQRLTLYFDGDSLSHFEGDLIPTDAQAEIKE